MCCLLGESGSLRNWSLVGARPQVCNFEGYFWCPVPDSLQGSTNLIFKFKPIRLISYGWSL